MESRSIVFRGGFQGLLAVLALLLFRILSTRLLGEAGLGLSFAHTTAYDVISVLGLLGALFLVLRWEEVSPSALGLSPRLALPAIGTTAGFFATFNVLATCLAVAIGQEGSIGYHWSEPPAEAAWTLLTTFLVAGLFEELFLRGYLQTKLIALCGGQGWRSVAAGIGLSSLTFSALHVPRVFLSGLPGELTLLFYLSVLALSALAFGLLYEFTHNLYVPVLFHTAGNAPGTAGILFVVPDGWSLGATAGYWLVYLGLAIGTVLLYRWWADETDRLPVWTERVDTWSPLASSRAQLGRSE